METSERGKNFIKRHEAKDGIPDLVAYYDVAGFGTIGYGHLIKPEDKMIKTVTKEEAEELFKKDLEQAESCVNFACRQVALMQNEYDALVSFVYNVGCRAFNTSTLLKELKASRPLQAGMEFKRWNRAGGKVQKILTNRRNAERRLFEFGDYDDE